MKSETQAKGSLTTVRVRVGVSMGELPFFVGPNMFR